MTSDRPDVPAWWRDAGCSGGDVSLWYASDPRPAVKKCWACPVEAQCLKAALEEEQDVESRHYRHGVRGGLTASERHALGSLVELVAS